jgi:hypothetical protein
MTGAPGRGDRRRRAAHVGFAHLAWYTEGLGHATRCRAEIFQARDADEVWKVFQTYWETGV